MFGRAEPPPKQTKDAAPAKPNKASDTPKSKGTKRARAEDDKSSKSDSDAPAAKKPMIEKEKSSEKSAPTTTFVPIPVDDASTEDVQPKENTTTPRKKKEAAPPPSLETIQALKTQIDEKGAKIHELLHRREEPLNLHTHKTTLDMLRKFREEHSGFADLTLFPAKFHSLLARFVQDSPKPLPEVAADAWHFLYDEPLSDKLAPIPPHLRFSVDVIAQKIGIVAEYKNWGVRVASGAARSLIASLSSTAAVTPPLSATPPPPLPPPIAQPSVPAQQPAEITEKSPEMDGMELTPSPVPSFVTDHLTIVDQIMEGEEHHVMTEGGSSTGDAVGADGGDGFCKWRWEVRSLDSVPKDVKETLKGLRLERKTIQKEVNEIYAARQKLEKQYHKDLEKHETWMRKEQEKREKEREKQAKAEAKEHERLEKERERKAKEETSVAAAPSQPSVNIKSFFGSAPAKGESAAEPEQPSGKIKVVATFVRTCTPIEEMDAILSKCFQDPNAFSLSELQSPQNLVPNRFENGKKRIPVRPKTKRAVPANLPATLRPVLSVFKFAENVRPEYFGTFSKKSSVVKPRNPLRKDTSAELGLNYEVDSDDEWEEGSEGDSVSNDDPEENVPEEPEEDDGFLVPDGYFSADEGVGDEAEEARAQAEVLRKMEEGDEAAQKAREEAKKTLKRQELEKERMTAELKRKVLMGPNKHDPLIPIVIAPLLSGVIPENVPAEIHYFYTDITVTVLHAATPISSLPPLPTPTSDCAPTTNEEQQQKRPFASPSKTPTKKKTAAAAATKKKELEKSGDDADTDEKKKSVKSAKDKMKSPTTKGRKTKKRDHNDSTSDSDNDGGDAEFKLAKSPSKGKGMTKKIIAELVETTVSKADKKKDFIFNVFRGKYPDLPLKQVVSKIEELFVQENSECDAKPRWCIKESAERTLGLPTYLTALSDSRPMDSALRLSTELSKYQHQLLSLSKSLLRSPVGAAAGSTAATASAAPAQLPTSESGTSADLEMALDNESTPSSLSLPPSTATTIQKLFEEMKSETNPESHISNLVPLLSLSFLGLPSDQSTSSDVDTQTLANFGKVQSARLTELLTAATKCLGLWANRYLSLSTECAASAMPVDGSTSSVLFPDLNSSLTQSPISTSDPMAVDAVGTSTPDQTAQVELQRAILSAMTQTFETISSLLHALTFSRVVLSSEEASKTLGSSETVDFVKKLGDGLSAVVNHSSVAEALEILCVADVDAARNQVLFAFLSSQFAAFPSSSHNALSSSPAVASFIAANAILPVAGLLLSGGQSDSVPLTCLLALWLSTHYPHTNLQSDPFTATSLGSFLSLFARAGEPSVARQLFDQSGLTTLPDLWPAWEALCRLLSAQSHKIQRAAV